MTSIIGKVITQVFIEFNESIGKEAIFFLTHLISECTNFEDMKEEFKLFCKENSLIEKDSDIDKTFRQMINDLKEKKDELPLSSDHPIIQSSSPVLPSPSLSVDNNNK
ncbi:hypothetical protein RB653_006606 [Dictyostelium firmibasis]|uniref:Uncharacterized protein n=1 Tax=Dictyostelium firmibasis TaxID=79012 RepID=A0AAN7TU71_9MYCE